MILPLEDTVGDVLSKAQKGLGIATEVLAERAGLSESQVRALRRGDYDASAATQVAEILGLRAPALAMLGEGNWRPRETPAIDGFRVFSTPFHEGWANAFLLWDERSGRAVAVDTGTNAAGMAITVREQGLRLEAVLLTHAHADHVGGLDVLRKAGADAVFVGEGEGRVPTGTQLVKEGFCYELGGVKLKAIATPGHTAGGLTYVVEGLAFPLALVGDALFAGSMGGANVSYQAGLDSLKRILALPEETVLAPGHGPLTTVGEELLANCFWNG